MEPVNNGSDYKKQHDNPVILQCSAIVGIVQTGLYSITSGQPCSPPPNVGSGSHPDQWLIDFKAGRHQTPPVANDFNSWVQNADPSQPVSYHEYPTQTVNGIASPSKLNFAFSLSVQFSVNGVPYPQTIFLAEGSNSFGQTWWLAGIGLISTDINNPPTFQVLDSNNNVVQTYTITISATGLGTPIFQFN